MSLSTLLKELTDDRYREVTVTSLMVFSAIAERHPHNTAQSDLGGMPGLENLSISSLARNCRLLCSLELIERYKNPHDARQFLLKLSEAGSNLWQRLQ